MVFGSEGFIIILLDSHGINGNWIRGFCHAINGILFKGLIVAACLHAINGIWFRGFRYFLLDSHAITGILFKGLIVVACSDAILFRGFCSCMLRCVIFFLWFCYFLFDTFESIMGQCKKMMDLFGALDAIET